MYGASFYSGSVLGLLLLSASLWCPWAGTAVAAEGEVKEPGVGVFLVARRGMPDPRFAGSVVLLVEYGVWGALGLIVNRPTQIPLASAFPDVEGLHDTAQVMWFGGPVAVHQAALLVASPQLPEQAHTVLDTLHFSMSSELLQSLLTEPAQSRFRVYAGHAGWAPAQLDAELARGDWHLRTASVQQALTSDPGELWKTLIGAGGRWVLNGSAWLPQTLPSITRMAGNPSP